MEISQNKLIETVALKIMRQDADYKPSKLTTPSTSNPITISDTVVISDKAKELSTTSPVKNVAELKEAVDCGRYTFTEEMLDSVSTSIANMFIRPQ